LELDSHAFLPFLFPVFFSLYEGVQLTAAHQGFKAHLQGSSSRSPEPTAFFYPVDSRTFFSHAVRPSELSLNPFFLNSPTYINFSPVFLSPFISVPRTTHAFPGQIQSLAFLARSHSTSAAFVWHFPDSHSIIPGTPLLHMTSPPSIFCLFLTPFSVTHSHPTSFFFEDAQSPCLP